jgi:hypothetical protein
MRDFEQPAETFPFGPYPADMLKYKGQRVVEYRTPPGSAGLGTYSWFEQSDSPIDGVAMLTGSTPDLFLLAVRLRPDQQRLTGSIVGQFEHDVAFVRGK